MPHIKKAVLFVVRMALASIAMSIAYMLSTTVIQVDVPMTAEEAQWAAQALFLVSTINALVLAYPILHSHWHGVKLIGAVILVQFGVETFMTQIETLYFNRAIRIGKNEMMAIVSAGALRALIFAPLDILFLGRMKNPGEAEAKTTALKLSGWGLRFAALAVLYAIVYFMFGYFVAWQWEETRLFYSGTTAILPFFAHFRALFGADPLIIPFQLLRGALWTALAVLIVRMMEAKRWEASLAVALIFAGLLSSGIGLFPNPVMPPLVRQSHFVEILFSMLLFGGIAGWFVNPSLAAHKVRKVAANHATAEQDLSTAGTGIQVRNFKKNYGSYVAVDDISFDVMSGEIFGLLGPNGAGKTSTLECLEGLRQPNGGVLRVAGIDPASDSRKLRNKIGVQLQSAGLPEGIKPNEAIRFFCAYHDVAPRFDLLERLGLHEKRDTQFFELSAGQQRRLALALAVAHDPKVLFLDEPTAGLDVASRAELHDLMRELKANGTTIILATHDMAEAEELSDRVAILLKGKIVAVGTPMEITSTGAGLTKVSVRTQNACLATPSIILPAVSQHLSKDEYNIYFSTDIGPLLSAIIAAIRANGDTLIDLRVERPSLEDRFLEITNIGVSQ
jgi:ABC-2 type transport system ATP-binding protein